MDKFKIKFESFASSSLGNCYLLSGYKTKILIECGIPIKNIVQKLDHKLHEIDGCLVSHFHSDHCKAIKDVASRGIDVFALKETFQKFGIENHHRAHVVKPKYNKSEIPVYKTFSIGEFKIKFFDVKHDCKNANFLIESTFSGEKLLFLIDCFYCRYKFDGLTHIVIETNFCEETLRKNEESESIHKSHSSRLWSSHFSLQRATDYLLSNNLDNVKQIYLTHLSASNGDGEHFKQTVQKATGKEVHICPA